jgi:hypothetical protein
MKNFMVRLFKQSLLILMVALGAQRAAGFALNGPFETYQVAALYYGAGDLGGPHMLGQEYRRNTPVLYYTFDEAFMNFFGPSGVAAVEQAIAAFNSITNVSNYSSDLSEFPMEATSFNYKAQALNLTDLKSYVMSSLAEQLGLAPPERFVWTLHDRDVGTGGCPLDVAYFVIKRNFDPVTSALDQLQTSSYVNGTYYSYYITEICSGSPYLADAVDYPVDPVANSFTSVAGFNSSISLGAYFNGLTRDDVAGLRYMLRTNNINIENAGAGTITYITNNAPQLLFTSNLVEFASAALTNDAVTLAARYPGLQIGSTTPIFTNVVTTTLVNYFTNYPYDPYGAPAHLVTVAVHATNVMTYYNHTFLNVYINPSNQLASNFQIPEVPGHSSTSGVYSVLTTNISTTACGPYSPYGSICTNVTITSVVSNWASGDFYILPTNFCAVSILYTQFTNAITVTNATIVATNASGVTNSVYEEFSQTPMYTFTQYVYVVNPVICPEDYTDRRQGIDRIRFVRYDGAFDSFTGNYNFPITNQYTLTAMPITNPAPVLQTIRRPVLRPDILFSAMDLTTEQKVGVRGGTYTITGFGYADMVRNLNFVSSNQIPNTVGPGTIAPGSELTYNSVGPLYLNYTSYNLDELTQLPLLAWGSFDGSTNAPIVYPNGTDLENYELSKFVNVTPVYLPEGYVTSTSAHTNYYSAQLQVASYAPNFTVPATWEIAPFPTSPGGLPPGLTLTTLNATNALISGTPTQAATFDFVVRLTDTQGRTLDHSFFIQVNP